MVKEYKCFEIGKKMEDTENMLNELGKEGWKLICSYAFNNYYLIMERDIKNGRSTKRITN
jgi:hypothetical protein